MVVRFALLFVIIAVFGCGLSGSKPDDILSEEQMVKVLAEIYVNEEKVNTLGLTPDSAHQVFEIMMVNIARDNNVSDSAVKKSIYYYLERPRTLDRIYATLIDTLQLREQRASYK